MTKAIICGVFAMGLFGSLAAAAIPEPELEWEIAIEGCSSASPVPYPTKNPDSVLLGIGGRLIRISGTGQLIYDVTFGPEEGRGGIADPVVADLNGDGTDDAVSIHKLGWVAALDGETGDLVWQTEIGGPVEGWQMPTVADLDGDGDLEIVAGNVNGWISCLDASGKLVWRSKVEEFRSSTVAVADINRDGMQEIVYGTATRYMVALDAHGNLLWRTFHPPHHMGRTLPFIGDLNRDGEAEIYTMSSMIGRDVGLVALNGEDGSERWIGATWHKAYNGMCPVRFDDGNLGILVCDKGSNVGAYSPDGTMRWRTQVSGRGIWKSPSVGDVDGDGNMEIVVGVRGGAIDGSGHAWYVLSAEGEVLGQYQRKGQFGGALMADPDQDGAMEVLMQADDGTLSCFSFGGPMSDEAVVSTAWRPASYTPSASGTRPAVVNKGEQLKLIERLPEARYGLNPLDVQLPSDDEDRYGVEITTVNPDGSRSVQVFHTQNGRGAFAPVWPVFQPGSYRLTLQLLDLNSGEILGEQELSSQVKDPLRPILDSAKKTAQFARDHAKNVSGVRSAANSLLLRSAQIGIKTDELTEAIRTFDPGSPSEQDRLADAVNAFLAYLDQSNSFVDLVVAEVAKHGEVSFAIWQDSDPWDNADPLDSIPGMADEPLSMWAFGNETESVVANVMNLSSEPITIRVEPGEVHVAGEEEGQPADSIAKLHRVVFLPSVYGETVPDVLPQLDEAYLIDLAPGEVRQLWINVKTDSLEPGNYALSWPIHLLDARTIVKPLRVALDVSTVSVPEENGFYLGFWSQTSLAGVDVIADQNEHLQTIWHRIGLPAGTVDSQGKLSGDLDWEGHDAVVTRIEDAKLIVYGGGVPVPAFPEGVEVTDDLRLTAQRNYFNAVLDHLDTLGLTYKNIAFYLEDETGLNGTHLHYMERAIANKAIDPRVQNYANPWGGITVENIRDMEPYTDFWQPGMETIEYLGPEYVRAMRGESNKPVSTYTPPGNCRVLRPLGFFRAQGWQALAWNIEGGGWWVYSEADLFATAPDEEPSYGGVNYDGRSLVMSRRWEATRDGAEDFNILKMLEAKAGESGNAEARTALDDAVAFVAGRTITGMPREAADYDLDFVEFQKHRVAVRQALEGIKR